MAFNLADFLTYSQAWVLARPLRLALVVALVGFVLIELCLGIARVLARRTAKRRQMDIDAEFAELRRQHEMAAVVRISDRKRVG